MKVNYILFGLIFVMLYGCNTAQYKTDELTEDLKQNIIKEIDNLWAISTKGIEHTNAQQVLKPSDAIRTISGEPV